MNYRFFEDTISKQFITNFNQVPELRPKLKDIVLFPPNDTKWVITRAVPISSSLVVSIVTEGGKNIVTEAGNSIISEASIGVGSEPSFDYFVRPQDSSIDTISLRGSNDRVLRQLFKL